MLVGSAWLAGWLAAGWYDYEHQLSLIHENLTSKIAPQHVLM
jgi:hypothetical protein